MISFYDLMKFLESRKWIHSTTILTVIGILALWYTMTNFIELSGLAFGVIKIPIGLAVIGLVDNIIFGDLDTIAELQEKNTAFAIVYASLVLLVGLILATV